MSLTDDDRNWMESAIADFETRAGAAIEQVKPSLVTEFHSSLVAELRSVMASAISESETRIRAAIERMETSLVTEFRSMIATASAESEIERVETSLLTEFHKSASPAEMRAKSHALAIRAFDFEVESLGERVTRLEPPH